MLSPCLFCPIFLESRLNLLVHIYSFMLTVPFLQESLTSVCQRKKNERFGTLRAIFFFFLALACRSGLFTSTRCPGPQKRVARLVYCKAQILKWHRRPIKKGPLGRLVRDTVTALMLADSWGLSTTSPRRRTSPPAPPPAPGPFFAYSPVGERLISGKGGECSRRRSHREQWPRAPPSSPSHAPRAAARSGAASAAAPPPSPSVRPPTQTVSADDHAPFPFPFRNSSHGSTAACLRLALLNFASPQRWRYWTTARETCAACATPSATLASASATCGARRTSSPPTALCSLASAPSAPPWTSSTALAWPTRSASTSKGTALS